MISEESGKVRPVYYDEQEKRWKDSVVNVLPTKKMIPGGLTMEVTLGDKTEVLRSETGNIMDDLIHNMFGSSPTLGVVLDHIIIRLDYGFTFHNGFFIIFQRKLINGYSRYTDETKEMFAWKFEKDNGSEATLFDQCDDTKNTILFSQVR